MAKLMVEPPTDLIRKIERLKEGVDKIAPAVLDAGMDVLERNLSRNLQRHRRTGELIRSIKRRKGKKDKKGVWRMFTGPTGKDPETEVPNMQKLMALEYGTSKGQQAAHVIQNAVKTSETPANAAMQEAFDRETKQLIGG